MRKNLKEWPEDITLNQKEDQQIQTHDNIGCPVERLGMSCGTRQKLSYKIGINCNKIRTTLDSINRDCRNFEDNTSAISTELIKFLAEDIAVLGYLVGQANGGIVDSK